MKEQSGGKATGAKEGLAVSTWSALGMQEGLDRH